jgi:uncharacterized membrane protein HdeD (DUF308 family)
MRKSDNEALQLPTLGQHWGWMLVWGLIITLLGVAAIYFSVVTTLISVVFIGALIFAGGIVLFIDAFKYWSGYIGSFIWHLVIAVLYIVVGIMLLQNPVSGSISLTLLLGLFYVFLGIARIVYSTSTRISQWQWSLIGGVIALFLGILILVNWPAGSLVIIGLFVGIDLVFCGWTYMLIALSNRSNVQRA